VNPKGLRTKFMKDIIIIYGAPGSGKTTVAELLQDKLQSPYVDFGWLRESRAQRGTPHYQNNPGNIGR